MSSDRKHSFVEKVSSENPPFDDHTQIEEKRSRRTSLIATPWMNKIKPFIYGAKSDDVSDCYNRVRYIRDSCKVLSDLWKTDKDFLNKSIDIDISKSFKEFRSSEVGRNYRSPFGPNGSPSILNRTIDDLIQIHDQIDSRRKESLEQFKKIIEQAKDKQSTIRQTMTELRDNYEKAQRKLEAADGNLKKFQTRSDRLTLSNFDERCRELEDIRSECEQARTLSRDIYLTEIYRISSEEHSITNDLFYQYLFEQNQFYNDISKYLSNKLPQIESRLETDDLKPSFGSDLIKHCSKRSENNFIAYPIEICIHLLKNHLREEGLFRIASSQIKQKKFVAELDLQFIDKTMNLYDLNYDPHVPASTLKQYLRELPDCLLTSALLPQWNEIPSISNEQTRLQRIGQLINQLPKIHYENLCYLVRFLSRVSEYSSENKMTPSNLAICIGCSILYPKDQTSSNTSMSNSYTTASTILELMIIHHKQFFSNNSNQQQEQTSKTIKSQPDIIPTEFHPVTKSRSGSNENLLDAQNVSAHTQPSPSTRRKAKAPPPPPSSSTSAASSSSQVVQNEQMTNTNQGISSEQNNSDQSGSSQHLTVTSSPSFTRNDVVHRRTPSGGNPLDRPGAPPPNPPNPPNPPSVVLVSSPNVQSKQKHSLPISNPNHYENNLNSPTDDKINSNELSNDNSSNVSTPTNENVNVGKLISELNNRMAAAAKVNNTQTNNNIRASSIRNSTITSPGETTDF